MSLVTLECSRIGDVADAGWRVRGGLALGSAGALGEAYSTLRVPAALLRIGALRSLSCCHDVAPPY